MRIAKWKGAALTLLVTVAALALAYGGSRLFFRVFLYSDPVTIDRRIAEVGVEAIGREGRQLLESVAAYNHVEELAGRPWGVPVMFVSPDSRASYAPSTIKQDDPLYASMVPSGIQRLQPRVVVVFPDKVVLGLSTFPRRHLVVFATNAPVHGVCSNLGSGVWTRARGW